MPQIDKNLLKSFTTNGDYYDWLEFYTNFNNYLREQPEMVGLRVKEFSNDLATIALEIERFKNEQDQATVNG